MFSIKRTRGIALTATAAVAALGIAASSASATTVPPAGAQLIRINPAVLAGLNPQPLPPKVLNPLVLRGLNPQPLPPRWLFMPFFG
jgi:hypothetical protein